MPRTNRKQVPRWPLIVGNQPLPEAEREQVAAHLANCESCRAEVERFRDVVDVLPLAASGPAPAGPRSKILAAAAVTPQETTVAPPFVTPPRVSRSPGWPARFGGWLAAAALLLLSLGRGAWNLSLQSQLHTRQAQPAALTALTATSDGAGAIGRVTARQGVGIITVRQLPPPRPGFVYEAWIIDTRGPQPAGTFATTPDGQASFVFSNVPNPGDSVAITAEPAPGTQTPTGNILLKGTMAAHS